MYLLDFGTCLKALEVLVHHNSTGNKSADMLPVCFMPGGGSCVLYRCLVVVTPGHDCCQHRAVSSCNEWEVRGLLHAMTFRLKWWQHRSLGVLHVMRVVDGQNRFPAALCRAVWRHAWGEWQCCNVIGLNTSYCSPATDNPSHPGQRKEGPCLVCGDGLVVMGL